MGEIPIDCPHAGCRQKSVTLRTIAATAVMGTSKGSVYGVCAACQMGVVLFISGESYPATSATSLNGSEFTKHFRIDGMAPERPRARSIAHLPQQVEAAFNEGEMNRADGRTLSAAGNYRTALDRTMKHFGLKGTESLYNKIGMLSGDHALPSTLVSMLHEIRFLGNEIHEEEDPDPSDVEAGAAFTELALTYLFDLPARIAAAEAKRVS